MSGTLSGQILVMTGGGMGFGECMAKAVAREGASVVIADVNLPEAQRVAEAINAAGGTAIPVEVDVTDEAQVRHVVDETIRAFGHMDILVNNAGVSGPSCDFVDIDKKDWDAVMDINVNGPFLCCRAALPHMIARRSGHIVNISSATARVGFTHLRSIPYTTTKFALEGLSWTLSVLMKDHGIRVNAICPGLATTNFQANSPKEYFVGARCWTADHTVGPLLYTLTELGGTGHSVEAIAWHEERGTAGEVSYIHD